MKRKESGKEEINYVNKMKKEEGKMRQRCIMRMRRQ
jgi:hypothetical protein